MTGGNNMMAKREAYHSNMHNRTPRIKTYILVKVSGMKIEENDRNEELKEKDKKLSLSSQMEYIGSRS